jgi:hypothetical protein
LICPVIDFKKCCSVDCSRHPVHLPTNGLVMMLAG